MTDDGSHGPYDGLAGLYALGGLNRVDRERFDQHLETCHACVETVKSLLPVTHVLSQAAAPQRPPTGLRDRIVRLESPAASSTGTSSPPPSPTVGQLAPAYRVVAVACLIVAGGFGWYAAQLVNQACQVRTNLNASSLRIRAADLEAATSRRVADDLRARADVLAAPDVRTIDLAGQPAAPSATGRVFLSGAQGAVLTASNVPQLPAGHIYQVWFIIPPDSVGVGLMRVDVAGRMLGEMDAPSDGPLPIAVAVTLEPEGGVDKPSGDVYLLGRTDQ